MQPYPRSPDLVWPGHLHGTGCLSARAMDTGFPTVVRRLCLGLGCGWVRVSAAPRHSCLGCWGVRALVCVLRLHPATPGTGARCECVCFCSGFGCAPPLLAGVLGCVRAPLAPSHSWHGCAVWVCVFGFGFWLRPATPDWGVGLCACSACTQPLLARVRGVGVCVCARVSAAPRHSWLGCWAVCVLRLHPATPGTVARVGVCVWARVSAAPRHSWLGCWAVCVLLCVLRLHPATPGTGARRGCVCLGSGFGCAPPLLAGVLGCVCAPLAPSHSWHGCAVWVCVFGLGFWLRSATPGWGVGLCACSTCTQPLLARVRGVDVCVWARVSAAPRQSWLGCWAVPVLRLHPATHGTGARCGCVCLGLRFGCAPPLLAAVLGCVRAPLAPATPGTGARCGCVCLGSGFGCAPPLLAGVLGCVRAPLAPGHSWHGCAVCVCVCVWARVPAAPRHFWLGCWAVCVLRLHPATPRTGARCGCVCLGSGLGCAPPLLARVLGCVRAPLAPSHSWHGCTVWVCVFGLGFRLRPATPGWGGGLCACSACTQPLLARVRGVGVCVWSRVSAAPRHSWLGCWAVCVLRLHPATPGTGARCGCVCLGSGFGCAPPLLAGVLGCVRAPLAPSHSWHGCAVWVRVSGLGLWLRPATPGWGVGLCVCSACTQPLLARVRGVGVCVWARALAVPRHSWLGCWAVCVLRLHPATPCTGARCGCVCLGSGFGCAPPLLAGVLGCLRAPPAPTHSWHGCAVWVCVFGLGLWMRPATPGWGVGLCVCSACTSHSWYGCAVWVCVLGLGFWLRPATLGWGVGLCACSACTQPLLARVRGVGVCVWARVLAAPRHSWLGCWAVCVLRLHPATPCTGARCGCVCLGSGFGCAPPLLAGVLGCVRAPPAPTHSWHGCAVWVCVFGLGLWMRPATPGWGVGLCVCSACTQPLLARVRGVGVCVWARVLAAPRHSWLGCWAVCVLRMHPATPGTGARCGCVCLGLGFGCAPPLLAGVCVGCVCSGSVFGSWLRFVVFGLAVAWHLSLCRGSLRVVRAVRIFGTRRPSLLGTCPCALVVGSGAPLWRAPWPHLVRRASSGPGALGAPVGFPVAVVPSSDPGACALGFTGRLRGARGGRPRTGLFVPAAGPRRGGGAGLAPRRSRSELAMGLSLAGPSGVCLGLLRCGGWRVWTQSLTRLVSPTVRHLTGDSTGAPGLFRVDADTAPCGSEDATPGSCACVRVLALLGGVGRAGLLGAFWCASPFLLAALAFCFASVPFVFPCPRPRCLPLSLVSGPGCLGPWRCALRFFFLPPVGASCALAFFFPLGRWLLPGACCPPPPHFLCVRVVSSLALGVPPPLFFSACAPILSGFLWFPAPGALGLGDVFGLLCGPPASWPSVRSLLFLCLAWPFCSLVVAAPPPPAAWCSVLFSFFFPVALSCSLRLCPVSGPGCLVPRRCASFPLLASRFSALRAFSPLSCLPSGRWLLPGGCPPPLFVSRGFRRFRSVLCAVCCAVLCVPGCGAALCSPDDVLLCAVLFCCARLVPLLVVSCPLVLPVALGHCALRRSVLRCSAAQCVFCRCVVVCAVFRRSALCCECPWVLCCAFPVLSTLCGTVLRCAGALALCCLCGACCCWRSVLWCAAVCCAFFFWCAVVRCWVWWPVVVCWCRAVVSCCPFCFVGGVGLCLLSVFAVQCCAARFVVRFWLRLRCCRCLKLWRVPVCCGVSLCVLRCGGAALLCRGVLLFCALSCGVLRPVLCPAVLCCLAVLCWWAVVCGCLRCWCLFFLLSSFPLLNTPAFFPCL